MSEDRRPAWKKKEKREPKVRPLEVEIRDGDLEGAIRALRKKMSNEGILAELKSRRFAEKPSEKKRREKREAIKKMRRSRGRKARQRSQANRRKKK
jgi:small subunit ribosomal protein S21